MDEETLDRMRKLGINEDDLVERFIVGSGRGGQKLQKTSSCVYLKHIPTGIEIKCQSTRSREGNRNLARLQLCDRLDERRQRSRDEKEKLQHAERQRRRGRSRKMKEKLLEEKRRRSQKKSMRRPPKKDDE